MVSNLDSHLHYPVLRVCPLKVIYSFPKIFKPPPTNCWLLAVCRINPQLTRSPNSSLSWSSTPTFCPVSECGALPHSNVLCSSPVRFPVSSPSCSPPAPAGEILFRFEAQKLNHLLENGLFDYPSCLKQIIPSAVAQHCNLGSPRFWLPGVLPLHPRSHQGAPGGDSQCCTSVFSARLSAEEEPPSGVLQSLLTEGLPG